MALIFEDRLLERIRNKLKLPIKIPKFSFLKSNPPDVEVVDPNILTFKDICPKWDQRVKYWKQLPMATREEYVHTLNYNSQKCFMGEAWMWTDDWNKQTGSIDGCEICKLFGGTKGDLSLVKPIGKRSIKMKVFERNKNEFVAHWNEAHRDMKYGV